LGSVAAVTATQERNPTVTFPCIDAEELSPKAPDWLKADNRLLTFIFRIFWRSPD